MHSQCIVVAVVTFNLLCRYHCVRLTQHLNKYLKKKVNHNLNIIERSNFAKSSRVRTSIIVYGLLFVYSSINGWGAAHGFKENNTLQNKIKQIKTKTSYKTLRCKYKNIIYIYPI